MRIVRETYLKAWQKRQLKDFFKLGVAKTFYERDERNSMKMLPYEWQDMQEHCQKEMEKLEIVMANEKFKLDIKVREYWLYYKELGRICAFKLAMKG